MRGMKLELTVGTAQLQGRSAYTRELHSIRTDRAGVETQLFAALPSSSFAILRTDLCGRVLFDSFSYVRVHTKSLCGTVVAKW